MMSDADTLQTLTDEAIRSLRWYYQVELRPGVYTDGTQQFTAAMVRDLLERIDLAGARCLDIGTQEGLITVSLARRGAETVVAYDRLDLSDRIALVKEAYGVAFDYQSGLQLGELSGALQRAGYPPFDVVVFAGVLYHMIDPLAGLGTARSFVREQGLVLIETAAIVSDEMVLYFNAGGRCYPSSTYFLPSLSWLDYCLRMLRLKPIDCLHLSKSEPGSLCRVALVCRAVDEPLAFPDDSWMASHWVEMDFRAVSLNYGALASSAPGVGYPAAGEGVVLHDETGSVDIYNTVLHSTRWPRNAEKARLNLTDYTSGEASRTQ